MIKKKSIVSGFPVVIPVMKIILFIPILFFYANCFSQKQRKVSAYTDFHVSTTIYDRTITNNSTGFGAGLQFFLNTNSPFKPNIEIASDAFGGTKEMYLTIDGRPIYSKDVVTGILIGSSYTLFEKLYFNAGAGPAFFNSAAYLSVKPALGLYFPRNKRFVFKISLTHVFQRDDISNESFGFLNFSIGIKLF